MVFVLWLKSRHKMWTLLALVVALAVMVPFMPEHWFERMQSIQSFDEDRSAMGRINAWWFAWNLVQDYPLTGGGYGAFDRGLFLIYAPDPTHFVDAHSIYFEVLGEQGFVGLTLFLALGLGALYAGGWVIRRTKRDPELRWARDLAAMLQVSLIGYAAGGLFLGLAYFDLYYHLIALVILLKYLVRKALRERDAERQAEARAAFPSMMPGTPRPQPELQPGGPPESQPDRQPESPRGLPPVTEPMTRHESSPSG